MTFGIKKLKFLALLVMLSPLTVFGQSSSEMGLLLGVSSYSGDLASGPFVTRHIKPAGGLFYRYMFTRKFGFRAMANFGGIQGELIDNPKFDAKNNRVAENYKMNAGVLEIAAVAEWFPFGGPRFNNAGLFIPRWTPYAAVGLGLAFADASIETGPDYQGPRFPEADDKSTFLTIPIIGGLRLDMTEDITVSFEVGGRPALSDYLDGVSENGGPGNIDWYWMGGVKVSYLLKGQMSSHSEAKN